MGRFDLVVGRSGPGLDNWPFWLMGRFGHLPHTTYSSTVTLNNALDYYRANGLWGSNPGEEKKFVCVYLPSLPYKCYVAVCRVYVCIIPP